MFSIITKFLTVSLYLCTLLCSLSFAEDKPFVVDQAETNNFEDFHKADRNKESRSLRDMLLGEKSAPAQGQNAQPDTSTEKRLIVSSTLNVNDVSSSITHLYNGMLKNCPDGFIKLREWSQKDLSKGDIILQYEYSCQ